ncbi:MAG: hypothetical protein F4Y04_06665 [Chloroflexi bacterium]|nr:hypothetical protein [Chloroflexota bacterium]
MWTTPAGKNVWSDEPRKIGESECFVAEVVADRRRTALEVEVHQVLEAADGLRKNFESREGVE